MDVVQFHYEKSIFVSFNNENYFNSEKSWTRKYIDGDFLKGKRKWFFGLLDYPVFLTDFWHLMKTSMLFLIVASIVFYTPTFTVFNLGLCKPLLLIFDFVLFGTLWITFFNIFYNRILIKK
jgi:hypothetical protein